MDDDSLGGLLVGVARALRRRSMAALEPLGLSPHQARALRVLGDEGLRVSALAQGLRIAPRSATEVADGLEAQGLVERAPDPDDRRAVLVRLTDAGRAVLARAERARTEESETLFARLDATERAQLARLLRQLAE